MNLKIKADIMAKFVRSCNRYGAPFAFGVHGQPFLKKLAWLTVAAFSFLISQPSDALASSYFAKIAAFQDDATIQKPEIQPIINVSFMSVRDIPEDSGEPCDGNSGLINYDNYMSNSSTGKTYIGSVKVVLADKRKMATNFRGEVYNFEPFPKGGPIGCIHFFANGAQFIDELRSITKLSAGTRETPLIYVHGFANNFSDAVNAAAYLRSYVTKGRPTLAFTWASNPNPFNVLNNYKMAESQADFVKRTYVSAFIKLVERGLGVKPDVVAHSLGARILFESYISMHEAYGYAYQPFTGLGKVIYPAADLRESLVEKYNTQISADFEKSYAYCMSDDIALQISVAVHTNPQNGLWIPLGLCVGPPPIIPYMHIIQASGRMLDWHRHSYFLVAPEMADDMSNILNGVAADDGKALGIFPSRRLTLH